MKKKNIINLIRYHSEHNEVGFKNEAYEIAREFDELGDSQLAQYIMSLLSNINTFVPQLTENNDELSSYFEKVELLDEPLIFPDILIQDLLGLVHAVQRNIGIHKFLFQGAPGTGKTEGVKHLAKILRREVYSVNFSSIIDSKLGQTQRNIEEVFKEIDGFSQPERLVILFDEIDALAMDRTNSNDLREMGRVTSTLLKCFDKVNEDIVIIATTNLFANFDKALIRRFDSIIDFNRYSQEDLLAVAEKFLDIYLSKVKIANNNIRIFRKVLSLNKEIPYPGELKNIIKTAVAFSDPQDNSDYLRRLYYMVCNEKPDNLKKLQEQKFTVREIEILANKSKSSVARELKVEVTNE